ncbi:MAG TPA: hypothetical protein VH518_00465 [Tepidisphaeraceae bacterium]|jgi:Tol biopolymer transport system component
MLALLAGCATTRVVTVNTRPADATLKVDNVDKGRGPYTQQYYFDKPTDVHAVVASRPGFKDTRLDLVPDDKRKEVTIELKPVTKVVHITVQPAPAIVSLDGKPLDKDPVNSISRELEFPLVDLNSLKYSTHTITAERTNFQSDSAFVEYNEKTSNYVLNLQPMKKSLSVTTTPPGADVLIDFQKIGTSPIKDLPTEFPVDLETNDFKPRKLRAEKPGYDPIEIPISWDGGKTDYRIDLQPKTKTVHIVTDPPGAVVKIDGSPVTPDSSGTPVKVLQFQPIDDAGTLKTYTATITKKTADSEWEPQTLAIGWENGRSEYKVSLKEILTRPVKLLAANMVRTDEGWEVQPQWTDTIAMKDVTEPAGRPSPQQLTRLAKGTQVGSIAVAPDGSHILFTVLVTGSDRPSDFRSQMLAIRTDGSGGADIVSDGKSLDLMPSYTPDGEHILFSSNRSGKRMNIWSMSAFGAPGVTRLTTGDSTHDLWPSVDSDPKARLFYQAMVDTRPDPRVYMTQLGTVFQTDLTTIAGTQPRVSPKNDAILFSSVNEKTGKRDIYRMSDRGGVAENLTNTPDADEFDASWSKDGSKIVFTSDRGAADDDLNRHHYDVWMLDLSKPQDPVRVTANGSLDDCPVFDTNGNDIFFRSNRGGQWQVWRVSIK